MVYHVDVSWFRVMLRGGEDAAGSFSFLSPIGSWKWIAVAVVALWPAAVEVFECDDLQSRFLLMLDTRF